jgi:hypothetical protein
MIGFVSIFCLPPNDLGGKSLETENGPNSEKARKNAANPSRPVYAVLARRLCVVVAQKEP